MRCHNAGKTSLFLWKTTLVNKETAKPSQKAAIFEWQRLSNPTSSKESFRPWQLLLMWNSLLPWVKIGFVVSGFWFCREVLPFCCKGIWFCREFNNRFSSELFAFGCIFFVLPGIKNLVLLWFIWFFCESFWFCREIFGCAVRYLVVLWAIWLCRDTHGPPYMAAVSCWTQIRSHMVEHSVQWIHVIMQWYLKVTKCLEGKSTFYNHFNIENCWKVLRAVPWTYIGQN
mgnify:CR=1 FL=1